jgi:hypothetical protein
VLLPNTRNEGENEGAVERGTFSQVEGESGCSSVDSKVLVGTSARVDISWVFRDLGRMVPLMPQGDQS